MALAAKRLRTAEGPDMPLRLRETYFAEVSPEEDEEHEEEEEEEE